MSPWICQASARSGSSIWSRKPASVIALYSSCMASAMALRNSSSLRVILVFHPMLDGPGCHGRQKGFGTLYTLESGLKIVDVGLDGSLAYERERARTDHLPAPQVASTGKVFWELLGVAAIDPRQRIPWFARTFCVAAETLAGIVRKVRLAELTVVDAVKTDGNLLLYDFSDRAA